MDAASVSGQPTTGTRGFLPGMSGWSLDVVRKDALGLLISGETGGSV